MDAIQQEVYSKLDEINCCCQIMQRTLKEEIRKEGVSEAIEKNARSALATIEDISKATKTLKDDFHKGTVSESTILLLSFAHRCIQPSLLLARKNSQEIETVKSQLKYIEQKIELFLAAA